MNTLGEKIKKLRKKAGFTQKDMACTILPRTSLSKIENGNLIPSLQQLDYIALKLNIDVTTLIKNDDDICENSTTLGNRLDFFEDLYNNKKYFDIIDSLEASDFATHFLLGMSYYKIQENEEALKYLTPCEELFNRQSDFQKYLTVEKLAYALNALRRLTITSFSDETNLCYLKKAIAYLKKYNNTTSEIYFKLNNNISVFLYYTNRYSEVISFATEFLKENLNVNSPNVLGAIHLNLGCAYFITKQYDKSIKNLKKSIFFFKYCGEEHTAGECYLNLFNCLIYDGNFKQCRMLVDFLFNYYSKDKKLLEMYKVLELNLLYNLNQCDSIFEKCSSITYNSLLKKTKSDFNFIMGRANFLTGNFVAASRYYKNCMPHLKEVNHNLDLALVYKNLYSISGKESYNNNYLKYKKIYEGEIQNTSIPNVTCPSYLANIEKL